MQREREAAPPPLIIDDPEAFQVPYEPVAKVKGNAGALAPANMNVSMKEALEALKEEVGDLTEYVREKLNYGKEENINLYYFSKYNYPTK